MFIFNRLLFLKTTFGLVPQETSLYPELSAVENLSFHAALYLPDLVRARSP